MSYLDFCSTITGYNDTSAATSPRADYASSMDSSPGGLARRLVPHQTATLDSFRATEKLIEKAAGAETEAILQLSFGSKRVFPNGVVPFAAALHHLRRSGRLFREATVPNSVAKTHLLNPLEVSAYSRRYTPLTNTVWIYRNEKDAQTLAGLMVDSIQSQVVCEEGVIETLNWCLYETMDNVFQHSEAEFGFVMMQHHWKTKLCAISIADAGIGIQKSLWNGIKAGKVGYDREDILKADAAIRVALDRGVTRRPNYNQGNGLYGLRRAAEINGGKLAIRSGWGYWETRSGTTMRGVDRSRPLLDIEDHQGTSVDWELDCSTPVHLHHVLSMSSPRQDVLEAIETPEGYHRVLLNEFREALGSRDSGREVRTRLLNYLNLGAPILLIDFTGIRRVVSSSFADEVFGKLALELGQEQYRRRVFLEHVSDTNRDLIERAVTLRSSKNA